MPPPHILVVEDHGTLRRVLRYSLARQGYRIDVAATGAEALSQARRHRPDLILLDLLLPDLDGLEVCRTLRRQMSTPIVMLTVRNADADRADGLRAGADDYVTKPFSMDDLRQRIATLLERDRSRPDPEAVATAGGHPATTWAPARPIALDAGTRTVAVGDEEVQLSPKEFELLSLLLAHPDEVQTRERIAETVWGGHVTSNTINVHIRWLREKFDSLEPPPFRIASVFGVGYRLDHPGDA